MKRFLSLFLCFYACALGAEIFGTLLHDPYKNAPLSALLLTKTDKLNNVKVTIAPQNRSERALTYTLSKSSIIANGGVLIYGLYEDFVNEIRIDALFCDDECQNIIWRARIKTPKISHSFASFAEQSNARKSLASSKFANALIFFNGQDFSYALDTNGNLRWLLNEPSSAAAFMDKSGSLVLLQSNKIAKFNLVGKKQVQFEPPFNVGKINALAAQGASGLYFAANLCDELHCSSVDSIISASSSAYKMVDLKDILNPARNEVRANSFERVCTLESKTLADWANISSISADIDGLIISLKNQNAILKINHFGHLMWLFSAARGWQKPQLRRLLKVQNAKFERLACNLDFCQENLSNEHFSYPGSSEFISVLGHKNGNLYLAIADSARGKDLLPSVFDKSEKSSARVFEIDERRQSAREIWRELEENDLPIISLLGDLAHLQMLSGSKNHYKFSLFAYDINTPNIKSNHSGVIDFSLDFSKQTKTASGLIFSIEHSALTKIFSASIRSDLNIY